MGYATAGGLYQTKTVFNEAQRTDPGQETVKRLGAEKLEPAQVALILSTDPYKNIYVFEGITIADLFGCNRYRLGKCDKESLKGRVKFFESLTGRQQQQVSENLRNYCRASFETVARECVKATKALLQHKRNDGGYLKRLNEALVSTEEKRSNGQTLDGELSGERPELEQFVVDN